MTNIKKRKEKQSRIRQSQKTKVLCGLKEGKCHLFESIGNGDMKDSAWGGLWRRGRTEQTLQTAVSRAGP